MPDNQGRMSRTARSLLSLAEVEQLVRRRRLLRCALRSLHRHLGPCRFDRRLVFLVGQLDSTLVLAKRGTDALLGEEAENVGGVDLERLEHFGPWNHHLAARLLEPIHQTFAQPLRDADEPRALAIEVMPTNLDASDDWRLNWHNCTAVSSHGFSVATA